MVSRLIILFIAALILSGCRATVPMADKSLSDAQKEFNAPSEGKAGLYIYRDSHIGKALYKTIWVDGECLGDSAPDVFFYTEVDGDREHVITTSSEFSPNETKIFTHSGVNYFLRQTIKLGVFVGGAIIERMDELLGKSAVRKLEMAERNACSY